MNDLDEYIHRCRLNLEPHHLRPADETDDKHCIICDISGARRHIRMDGLCINGLPLDEVMYVIEHPEPPKPRADVRTPEFIEPLV